MDPVVRLSFRKAPRTFRETPAHKLAWLVNTKQLQIISADFPDFGEVCQRYNASSINLARIHGDQGNVDCTDSNAVCAFSKLACLSPTQWPVKPGAWSAILLTRPAL